jgi:hypothetical protein
MALIIADRVRETATTTGTGAFTLAGVAPSGYRTFDSVCANADTIWYVIQHQTADEWEVGLGTSNGTTGLTRTTVYASSNAGAAVNFSAGTKDVFSAQPTDTVIPHGGTDLTGLLQGNGAAVASAVTDSSTVGQVLRVTGAATYGWGALDLADTDAVTGTLPVGNGGTGITALGTGVATALGVNVGSAGAFVTFNGALGTPSSGTLTNATGLPSIIAANEATDTTCFPAFFTAATGELGPKTNANLTFNSNTGALGASSLTVGNTGLTVGASTPFSDAAGTLTLQNVDALDATTEATVEAAIDTLANLTSIQGLTVTLADAGADAILGWDDSAGAYENLTQGEVHAVIGTLPVANGGTGQTTEAEAIGEMVQALTADATPDWAADYIPSYDASADTGKKLLLSTVWREKLTAARTYYVRTDGGDSNTGLVDSAGGAFLTIQKAITTVGGLDFSGQTVTISVADGTYTAGFDFVAPWVGGGHLILEGDTTTPANALVDIATGDVFKISVPPPGIFTIRGFKLDTPDGTCISHVSTGTINVNNINFATTTSWQMAATAPGGVISSIGGSLTTSGSAGAFILAFGGGSFLIQGSTITLTGTPAFSVAFVWATRTGFISADGITFSGSATGTRYLIDAGGTIYTSGGGATYFPGDSAGSGGTTTGGGFYA